MVTDGVLGYWETSVFQVQAQHIRTRITPRNRTTGTTVKIQMKEVTAEMLVVQC
jgi:hypothetical protein